MYGNRMNVLAEAAPVRGYLESEIPLRMYQVPGYPLNPNDIDKYKRSCERLDNENPNLDSELYDTAGEAEQALGWYMEGANYVEILSGILDSRDHAIRNVAHAQMRIMQLEDLQPIAANLSTTILDRFYFGTDQDRLWAASVLYETGRSLQCLIVDQQATDSIQTFLDEGLSSQDINLAIDSARVASEMVESEGSGLLERIKALLHKCFERNDPGIGLKASEIIRQLPPQDQEEFRLYIPDIVRECFLLGEDKARLAASNAIGLASTSIIPSLCQEGLLDPSVSVRKNVLYQCKGIEPSDAIAVYRTALRDEHPNVVMTAFRALRALIHETDTESEILDFMLSHKDENVRAYTVIEMVRFADKPQIARILKQALRDPSDLVRITATSYIAGVSPIHATEIIDIGMNDSNPKVVLNCARWIFGMKPTERHCMQTKLTELCKTKLHDITATDATHADLISLTPLNERASLIRIGIRHPSPSIVYRSARMIAESDLGGVEPALRAEVSRLILSLMRSDQPNVGLAIDLLPYSDKTVEGAEMLRLVKESGAAAIRSRLYDYASLTGTVFGRENFQKTGSTTMLAGGELYNKVIFRQINKRSFKAWRELYENHQAWQQGGFDYVPIEPIVSFRETDNNEISVATGVLDTDLYSWQNISNGVFMNELYTLQIKIEEMLNSLGYDHGHIHMRNYCVRFFRNSDGTPDLSRVPRLYLIDFDQIRRIKK